MIVRGKLEECHWTDMCLLLQLAEDAGFERLTRDSPRDRRMVEALCTLMDLPVNEPLCLNLGLAYQKEILNDEQWELLAHLLRKVKGTVAARARE